ncbi:hypothetical protein ACFV4P_31260 [Kitasatospora sp. NPDC059795]|uniref:hypothetical protein n=1 Tax=Kitasatospora sp. NPDC059795 TaxID=3346949 RepID=UPI00364B6655
MTSPALPDSPAAGLAADLAEESEQLQILARSLDLPPVGADPALALSRHLLTALVHVATTTATAAAVVDLSDTPTPTHLRSLASITSGLSCTLAATSAMANTLYRLATDADPAELLRGSRTRAAALLTSASAHLGTAAAQLRPPQRATDPAA